MKKLVCVSAMAVLVCGVCDVPAAEKSRKGDAVVTSVDKAGRTHVVQGYVPMKAAPGTKKFAASPRIQNAELPRKVDLRAGMTKVENQGETSSCVANAVAGSFEYWVKRATQADFDVSRLFIYYNARWRNGDQDKDEGSVIQLAMEGLKEFGACAEEKWPFDKPLLLKKPNREAYKAADQVKIKEMNQVPLELKAWKQALASGYPIVFGCLLFESFDQCNQRGGVVPMPNPADVSRESHGGHSMTAVGYSDKEQVFIVRNSWGDQWGDKGYCYMPYDYLMNPRFNGGDSWVFVPEMPLEHPEDTWFNDDQPVTDDGRGVDFVINPYTIESYAEVVLPFWEEVVVEYNDDAPEAYEQYVEYADTDNWDEMESFEVAEVVEAWEEENPGEEAGLVVYDGEEAEEEAGEEVADETMTEDAGDEEADAEEMASDEEISEDEGDDMQAADEETAEEEEMSGDEGDEETDAGDEMSDEEMSEDDGEGEDDAGDEEAGEDEGGGDEGGEDDGGGDDEE